MKIRIGVTPMWCVVAGLYVCSMLLAGADHFRGKSIAAQREQLNLISRRLDAQIERSESMNDMLDAHHDLRIAMVDRMDIITEWLDLVCPVYDGAP